MRSARVVILRTLAIAFFTGLTLGGFARPSSADSGTEPVYRYGVERGATLDTAGATGSAAGGWVASGYTQGTDPVYLYVVDQGSQALVAGSAGSGTGGPISSEPATGTEPVFGYAVNRGTAGSLDNRSAVN